jgi:hypothetical protein
VRKDGGRNQIYIDKSESKAMQTKAMQTKAMQTKALIIYEELNLGGKARVVMMVSTRGRRRLKMMVCS